MYPGRGQAVVYALGQVNFLFDASGEPHLTADELSAAFGVAKSTMSGWPGDWPPPEELTSEMQEALAEAIAARTGIDAEQDMYPPILAGAVTAATQVAVRQWFALDPPAPLRPLPRGGFVHARLVPIRPVPGVWLARLRAPARPRRGGHPRHHQILDLTAEQPHFRLDQQEPPLRPGLRTPARQPRGRDPLGHGRTDDPPPHPNHPVIKHSLSVASVRVSWHRNIRVIPGQGAPASCQRR